MNIAVITGASSGLGKEYVKAVYNKYSNLDEILIIARREDRLIEIAKGISEKIVPVSMDITSNDFTQNFENLLKEKNANIRVLINNAGFGKLGNFYDISVADNRDMITLNCTAFTVLERIALEYMNDNAKIINICSIASFAPNSRMAVYSSTKAYVMSFSRALREELKPRKINVLAVCPGPMDTEFLSVANIKKGTSKTFDTLPRVSPKTVAEKSLVASEKNRAVYTNRLFYKFYRFVAKILPANLVVRFCGA